METLLTWIVNNPLEAVVLAYILTEFVTNIARVVRT